MKTKDTDFSEEAMREAFLEEVSIATKRNMDGRLYSLGLHEDYGDADILADYGLKVLADYKAHLRERLKKMEMPLYKNATNARDKAIFDSNYGYNQGLRNAANILS